jgi:hypothetical protein
MDAGSAKTGECFLDAMFRLDTRKNRITFEMNRGSAARGCVGVSPIVPELTRQRTTP